MLSNASYQYIVVSVLDSGLYRHALVLSCIKNKSNDLVKIIQELKSAKDVK